MSKPRASRAFHHGTACLPYTVGVTRQSIIRATSIGDSARTPNYKQ
jgi:hypothetical protein